MSDQLRKVLPLELAVPLIGRALALRVIDENTWYAGYYEDLRATLNPLRLAAGYGEITTPGGVRKGLAAAQDVYDVRVLGRHAPLLVRNSPLFMEAVIRRTYNQEVLGLWRQILHERKFAVANLDDLNAVFGVEPTRFKPFASFHPGT